MYNIVVVGYGEIARKAHTPAILGRSDCQIVAIVDIRNKNELGIPSELAKVPVYKDLQTAVQRHLECNGAAICTPQQFTLDFASEAVKLGLHVLLEKPPGDYKRLPLLWEEATRHNSDTPSTVFTAYHSSAPPGLPHIQAWIQQHATNITSIHIEWKENVKKWHPGQNWVTTREGLGVLDIVFNPLSLLVHVLPKQYPLILENAQLNRPTNWESPISGTVKLRAENIAVAVDFAWDYIPDDDKAPEELWNITFTASTLQANDDEKTCTVSIMRVQDGGTQVYVDGVKVTAEPTAEYMIGPEYVNLYDIFVNLMNEGRSYIDATTPRLIQEIVENAEWTEVDKYNI